MNDNTILRIKVPAHLYESVKEQLTINEAKSTKAFGDWKVVKEKKLPKDGMKKVEEADKVEETNQIQEKEMEKKTRTLEELKAAKEKLEARINEMEGGDASQTASLEDIAVAMDKALAFAKKLGQQIAAKKGGKLTQKDQSRLVDNFRSKVREFSPLKSEVPQFEGVINEMEMHSKDKKEENLQEIDPKYQAAMEVLNSVPIIAQIAKMDPFAAGMALVGMVTGGTIAAPKISAGLDYLMTKIKNPKKKDDLADYAQEKGVDVSGQ